MAAMPRNQDNDREVWADCRVCGGVDGLYLQHEMIADTCVYCDGASNAAEPPKPIMKKPAQAKAAKAKAASAKTALSVRPRS